MPLREATADDVPALAALYADTVRAIGAARYAPEQVEAWARAPNDTERFRAFILTPRTLVLEEAGEVLGFCGIEDDGHVASLYVDPRHAGRGLGGRLLETALNKARARGIGSFYAEASLFSLPVFARCGFVHHATEQVLFGGVEFERYLVATDPDRANGM